MFMMSRVGLGASRVASVVKSLLSLVAVDELFVFPFFMWTKITRLILIFYPFVCLVAPSLGATLEFFFLIFWLESVIATPELSVAAATFRALYYGKALVFFFTYPSLSFSFFFCFSLNFLCENFLLFFAGKKKEFVRRKLMIFVI